MLTTPHLLLFHFHVFNESVKSRAASGELDARTGSVFAGVAGEAERGGWWVEEGSGGNRGRRWERMEDVGGCALVVMNVPPVKKNSVSLPQRGRNKGGGGEREEMWEEMLRERMCCVDGAEFSAAGQTLLPS